MKKEMSKNQKIFIWFIFIFASIVLIDNFFFLEFWYAKRDPGFQNGFHIFNTEYSIFHWFGKISYLSCIGVVIWSGFEVASIYNPKLKPRFIYRYLAVFWITATMVGESWLIWNAMQPRIESIWNALFNNGPWLGVNGAIYSFLDGFQFISIHTTIPILVLIYVCIWDHNEVKENEVRLGMILIVSSMLGWYLYGGIITLAGVNPPYPIIDWTPNHTPGEKHAFALWFQVLFDSIGAVVILSVSYITLNILSKQTQQ